MIPNLDNIIKAYECPGFKCKACPYGYGYFDDNGDNYFWTCDLYRLEQDALFYLKLYQHLIKEEEKKTNG